MLLVGLSDVEWLWLWIQFVACFETDKESRMYPGPNKMGRDTPFKSILEGPITQVNKVTLIYIIIVKLFRNRTPNLTPLPPGPP